MNQILVGVSTAVLAIAGCISFLKPHTDPVQLDVVAVDDIARLEKCVSADTCKIPRTTVWSEGLPFWSVKIAENGKEMQYLIGEDSSIKLMLTNDGKPILIEDCKYVGIVCRITQLSDGKPQMSELGDEGFRKLAPVAQRLYFEAMQQAKKHIIPPQNKVQKET